jgi:hypothetical protein
MAMCSLFVSTQHASQLGAEESSPSLLADDPRAHLPGRIVSHVLRVTALELSDPMTLGILVKAHDAARDRGPIGAH